LILRPHFLHVRVVAQVILAIGQHQAALHQIRGVVVRIVETRGDPQAKQIGGVEVGVVQRVRVRAQRLAQRPRQILPRLNRRNRVQLRFER